MVASFTGQLEAKAIVWSKVLTKESPHEAVIDSASLSLGEDLAGKSSGYIGLDALRTPLYSQAWTFPARRRTLAPSPSIGDPATVNAGRIRVMVKNGKLVQVKVGWPGAILSLTPKEKPLGTDRRQEVEQSRNNEADVVCPMPPAT